MDQTEAFLVKKTKCPMCKHLTIKANLTSYSMKPPNDKQLLMCVSCNHCYEIEPKKEACCSCLSFLSTK